MKPTSDRNITQRDIAQALGVSKATVSLALRDSEALSRKRCEEIQAVAREMGYRPNPAAAELSRHRRNSTMAPTHTALAWINAWQPPEKLRAYKQFDYYWNGADEAARKLGYHLEEFRIEGSVTPDRLHRILESRGIRGVLLPPQSPHPDWQEFPWEKYSIVRFGRSLRHPQAHVVSSDHVTNAILAFTRMREAGYRRIGFLTNETALVQQAGHLSIAGFLMAQQMVDESERVPTCSITRIPNSGRASAVAMWLKKHRVDAVFTDEEDAVAILQKAGIRAPGDIGLVSLNIHDLPVSAGIDQNPMEIGKVALLMLHSLITDHERGIPGIFRQLLVKGTWIDGESLPDKTRSASQ
jgi:LacI family repressor for deo operon, udp, cdd, tsx, nupC, and nupG